MAATLYLQSYIQNLVENGPLFSEKSKLNFHMLLTLGKGQEMTLTLNTHISSLNQLFQVTGFNSFRKIQFLIFFFFYRKAKFYSAVK